MKCKKRDMKRQKLWIAVTICYILFIFSNSMKPAALSSKDSSAALLLIHSAFAQAGINASWLSEHMVRKLAHFSEYTLLGILLKGCLCSLKLPKRQTLYFLVMAGFFIPFVDETIQLFVEGRSGQISDVWLDSAGIAFGILLNRMEKSDGKKL